MDDQATVTAPAPAPTQGTVHQVLNPLEIMTGALEGPFFVNLVCGGDWLMVQTIEATNDMLTLHFMEAHHRYGETLEGVRRSVDTLWRVPGEFTSLDGVTVAPAPWVLARIYGAIMHSQGFTNVIPLAGLVGGSELEVHTRIYGQKAIVAFVKPGRSYGGEVLSWNESAAPDRKATVTGGAFTHFGDGRFSLS